MGKSALILIDIQKFYFEEGSLKLVRPEIAADNAVRLLAKFREKGLDVIHIKHRMLFLPDYKLPIEELVKFDKKVEPIEGECVLEKTLPNSFYKTGLKEILESKDIDNLVIAGMMSNVCVLNTTIAAKDYGYKVTVAEDASATKSFSFNNMDYDAQTIHNVSMASLNGAVADIKTVDEIIKEMF